MLALILMLVAMNAIRKGLIVDSFRMAISGIDRNTFSQTETKPLVRITGGIVRLGIAGMALYMVTCVNGLWHITHYVLMMLLIAGLHIFKTFTAFWMNWLFQWVNRYDLIMDHLTALWTAVAVLLLPINLVYLYFPGLPYLQWVLLGVIGVSLIAFCIKLLQLRMSSPIGIVFILIYLLTTEILPLWGVFSLAQHINNTL